MHWQAESEIQVYQEKAQLHSFAGQTVHPGRAAARPPPTPCPKLINQTACKAAVDTERSRCEWNATVSRCQLPPPPPPPQPCDEITHQDDCRWSNSPTLPKGRDCWWFDGNARRAPPPLPLPPCAVDHSCAHNGMSDVPPMGAVPPRQSNIDLDQIQSLSGAYNNMSSTFESAAGRCRLAKLESFCATE